MRFREVKRFARGHPAGQWLSGPGTCICVTFPNQAMGSLTRMELPLPSPLPDTALPIPSPPVALSPGLLPLTAVRCGPGTDPSWSPGTEPPDALWLHRDKSVPLAPAPQALGQDQSPAGSRAGQGWSIGPGRAGNQGVRERGARGLTGASPVSQAGCWAEVGHIGFILLKRLRGLPWWRSG